MENVENNKLIIGKAVHVFKESGELKAIFPATGYRPTKATKEITINCFRFALKWNKTKPSPTHK
jgi:hypothetical protein